jgi:hypothetical protein
MRANGWSGRALACLPALALMTGFSGCKAMSERYIALEVWKYEKCFGHLPPGFVPAGAAAAMAAPAGPPARVCGQGNACPPAEACDPCQSGSMGQPMGMGMGAPAGMDLPLGPGGSPGPTPAGMTAGRPIVISDEVVSP